MKLIICGICEIDEMHECDQDMSNVIFCVKHDVECSECGELLEDSFEKQFGICSFCSDEQLRYQNDIQETNMSLNEH